MRRFLVLVGVLLAALPLTGASIIRTYAPASYSATPSDPLATASTSTVMMGLAGSITPRTTGNVLVYIGGTVTNGTAAKQTNFQIRRGGGTAPLNGAAASGNVCGAFQTALPVTGGDKIPASLMAECTGITIGATQWIDLAMFTSAAGSASITGVYIAAVER